MIQLKEQEDFLIYLDMLYALRKRSIIIISSSDTPVGPCFTKKAAAKLLKLGLRVNLENQFRLSYAAIIDAKINLFEKLAADLKEPVEHSCSIGEINIKVCATGFNVPKDYASSILINDINYSTGKRGLNFVIYDKEKQTVIDAVNFDTYAAKFTCHRPSSLIEGVLNCKKEHPDVSILSLGLPGFPQKDLSVNEQIILDNGISRAMIMQQPDHPSFIVNKYIDSPEGVIEVLNTPSSFLNINGIRRFEDITGKYVNIVGGHRVTIGQPKLFKRTVYLVGGCTTFGVGSYREHTNK